MKKMSRRNLVFFSVHIQKRLSTLAWNFWMYINKRNTLIHRSSWLTADSHLLSTALQSIQTFWKPPLAKLSTFEFDSLATCLIHRISVVSGIRNHTKNKKKLSVGWGASSLMAPLAALTPSAGTELLAGAELLLTGAELGAALASAVPGAATLAAAAAAWAAASPYLIWSHK